MLPYVLWKPDFHSLQNLKKYQSNFLELICFLQETGNLFCTGTLHHFKNLRIFQWCIYLHDYHVSCSISSLAPAPSLQERKQCGQWLFWVELIFFTFSLNYLVSVSHDYIIGGKVKPMCEPKMKKSWFIFISYRSLFDDLGKSPEALFQYTQLWWL